jgi:hypothetical protein
MAANPLHLMRLEYDTVVLLVWSLSDALAGKTNIPDGEDRHNNT